MRALWPQASPDVNALLAFFYIDEEQKAHDEFESELIDQVQRACAVPARTAPHPPHRTVLTQSYA